MIRGDIRIDMEDIHIFGLDFAVVVSTQRVCRNVQNKDKATETRCDCTTFFINPFHLSFFKCG